MADVTSAEAKSTLPVMKAALIVNRPQPAAHMCGQPATTRR